MYAYAVDRRVRLSKSMLAIFLLIYVPFYLQRIHYAYSYVRVILKTIQV